MEGSVLVIGGGAAGLAAAQDLAHAGLEVTILEARDRLGGRMFTLPAGPKSPPIELGAEFIHGEEHATWDLIRAGRLRTVQLKDRHWRVSGGKLQWNRDLWDDLTKVFQRINPAVPDQHFQSFLDQAWSLPPETKRLARDYVESYHAAPADRIGTHALALTEAAAERDRATQQFRLADGYLALVGWMVRQLTVQNVQIRTNAVVKLVRWEPGQVEVITGSPPGQQTYRANRAVIALPLGVLKQEGPGGVRFEPGLGPKQQAIRGLELGSVVKLNLHFSTPVWPRDKQGFVHLENVHFPVWWSDPKGLLVTGWSGGPAAATLEAKGTERIIETGLRSLSSFLEFDPAQLKTSLIAPHLHDWAADPFTLGAYSYTPARMMKMPAQLAAPLSDTLFFAGEATDTQGEQGTVHGAVASGKRTAREILAAARKNLSQPAELQNHR
jgi:monoamine oxidase